MLPLFASVAEFFKKRRKCHIDYPILRLHCIFTSVLLIAFSLAVTARQYFGDPIHCIQGKSKLPQDLTETYCWIHSTYHIKQDLDKKLGQEAVYPGIAVATGRSKGGNDKKYFAYYQWVSSVLFLQGLFFYLPRHVWKILEDGLIDKLTKDLRNERIRDHDTEAKIGRVARYLAENRGCHKWYAIKYILCEILCLLNVVLQVYVTDLFLNGDFATYGFDVFQFFFSGHADQDADSSRSPFITVFPKMTKCSFFYFGPAGGIQNAEVYCLLPLNIVNEKIYLILWVWLVLVLITLLVLTILFRFLVTFGPRPRSALLRHRLGLGATNAPKVIDKWKTRGNVFIDDSDFGDSFLIFLISKNITHSPFLSEILATACDFEKRRRDRPNENSI